MRNLSPLDHWIKGLPHQRNRRRPKKQATDRMVSWFFEGLNGRKIGMKFIEHFDARGMRKVYGREDHFGRVVLRMSMWVDREGRCLVRFWSRSSEVDWEWHEVLGLPHSDLQQCIGSKLDEFWVPECLRDSYDNWVLSEMPYVW